MNVPALEPMNLGGLFSAPSPCRRTGPQGAGLQARFEAWLTANPDVEREFRQIAEELYAAGVRHYSVAGIWEQMRFRYTLRTRGDVWKLNNSYRSRMARRLAEQDRRFQTFFEFRALTAE